MKKQKVIILGSDQNNKLEIEAINEIQDGLSRVDHIPIYTPDLQWFEQMVLVEQQTGRKKLVKDLLILLIVALFILSGLIVSLYQKPVIFIILQIVTTAVIMMYTSARFFKKVDLR